MMQLKDIFTNIENGTLLLPDFQRDYKWGMEKQRNLLASLLLKFPIGSTLILNGNSDDFAARKIGELKQTEQIPSFKCKYLLDGQQRTTTLFNALNNTYSINDYISNFSQLDAESKSKCRSELKSILSVKANSLKVRWFLKIPNGEDVSSDIPDLFGAKALHFDSKDIDSYEPEDIAGIIKEQRFDEKNTGVTKWFSPFYEVEFLHSGKSEKQFYTHYIDECIKQGLLPLFLIGEASSEKNRIVIRILHKLAQKNSQSLKDSLDDDLQKISKYDFDGILEEYETKEEVTNAGKDFDNLLDQIFKSLEDKWVNDVYNYLVKDIYNDYELLSITTDDIRRAIPIFCHLNEGGMKLDDFDLLAARAAKKQPGDTETYSLSNVVRSIMSNKVSLSAPLKYETDSSGYLNLKNFDSIEDGLPVSYVKSAVLAVCSLLAHGKKERFFEDTTVELTKDKAKSKALLSLSTKQIRDNIEIAVTAVLRAFAFLSIRCGIYNARKLHYTLMIQPIAFAFTNKENWESKQALNKIEYWYWSSLFSGAYVYDQSSVAIQDINSLYRFLEIGENEVILARGEKVFKNKDYSTKELLIMKETEYPREGIRAAILQFILSEAPYDLTAGEVSRIKSYKIDNETNDVVLLTNNSIHDHHLIPVDIRKKLGETSDIVRDNPAHILNSPLNRIFISAGANLKINSLDPVRYFTYLGASGLYKSNILNSNHIPENFTQINTDNCNDESIALVIEKRFEQIETAVKERLLALNTN